MTLTQRDIERFPDFAAARHAVISVLHTRRVEMYQDLFDNLCAAGFYGPASALMTAWARQLITAKPSTHHG